jgi:hypothetical protein
MIVPFTLTAGPVHPQAGELMGQCRTITWFHTALKMDINENRKIYIAEE